MEIGPSLASVESMNVTTRPGSPIRKMFTMLQVAFIGTILSLIGKFILKIHITVVAYVSKMLGASIYDPHSSCRLCFLFQLPKWE
jgi:hypothetical protein